MSFRPLFWNNSDERGAAGVSGLGGPSAGVWRLQVLQCVVVTTPTLSTSKVIYDTPCDSYKYSFVGFVGEGRRCVRIYDIKARTQQNIKRKRKNSSDNI